MDSVFRRGSAQFAAAIVVAALCGAAQAQAAGTPPEPSAPQPALPQPIPSPGGKPPVSPVVEHTIAATSPLVRRKHARRQARLRRHLARHYGAPPGDLERPAVAGVTLLVPLPRPDEPPHFTVPVPAYPLESLATFITTPPTPVVCHPVPREPGLPDPELYRERTLQCQPDNP